jgi:glycosyltransferase involved in cell wall biosynthesis
MDLLLGLAKAFPDVSFLWIGGKPKDIQPWRETLANDGLQNVSITGFIENSWLPLYQAAAEILVMPYNLDVSGSGGGNIVEVFNPMKMFDYLAAGRAIISSDLPVLHEVLNPQNAAFAVPGDLDSWKETLSILISNPEVRRVIGEQARKDAAGYDWRIRTRKALEKFP